MKHNRRHFLKTTSSASSALLLSSFKGLPQLLPTTPTDGYKLLVLATNWGFNGSLDAYCSKAKSAGYDGIEIWWPLEAAAQNEIFTALKKHNLQVGFLCGAGQKDFKEHLAHFQKMIDGASNNTVQKPLYINCHSGRDFFSYEENKKFIDYTTAASVKSGIPICHETHRSRMLYAAPVAKQYLQNNKDLRITFDVSHWCNVSESLLQDQPENIALAIERTDHVHARIGHAQGPQVSDPRAPEWEAAVKAHVAWWDRIAERKKKEGKPLTVLTEFGPPDYMPVLPYTRQPLADQWAINVHMMGLLRQRYA